jgi:hypothetical protein
MTGPLKFATRLELLLFHLGSFPPNAKGADLTADLACCVADEIGLGVNSPQFFSNPALHLATAVVYIFCAL